MKKILFFSLLMVFCFSIFTGCGAFVAMSGAGGGLLYSDTKSPLPQASYYGTTSAMAMKKGEASYTSILGLICTGDASIDAAMKNGNITKVHHIDQKLSNILGIIATYTVVVYGE
jgi:TRL-like protein family